MKDSVTSKGGKQALRRVRGLQIETVGTVTKKVNANWLLARLKTVLLPYGVEVKLVEVDVENVTPH